MKLNDSQQRTCRLLHDMLSSSVNWGDAKEDSGDFSNDLDWYSSLELCNKFFNDTDGELDNEEEDPVTNNALLAEHRVETWLSSLIAENPIQACILDILVSLYTQLPTGHDDKLYSPILRFVVLSLSERMVNGYPLVEPPICLLYCFFVVERS